MTRRGLLLICALVFAGCDSQRAGPLPPDENWKGTEHVDPAGDVAALQGRWEHVEPGKVPVQFRGLTYLTFTGNIASFDYASIRARGEQPVGDEYVFVLNSSLDPKVFRYTRRLGPGEPLPGSDAPLAFWYRLEGDKLWIWDAWEPLGETGKAEYSRIKSSAS